MMRNQGDSKKLSFKDILWKERLFIDDYLNLYLYDINI